MKNSKQDSDSESPVITKIARDLSMLFLTSAILYQVVKPENIGVVNNYFTKTDTVYQKAISDTVLPKPIFASKQLASNTQRLTEYGNQFDLDRSPERELSYDNHVPVNPVDTVQQSSDFSLHSDTAVYYTAEELKVVMFSQNQYLRDIGDVIAMAKYITTQSQDFKTQQGLIDNYWVIQVMFNRMRKNHCSWIEYWNNKTINQSTTIAKIKKGRKVSGYKFDWNDPNCILVANRIINKLAERVEPKYKIAENIYYFHSHPWKFGTGIWKKSNYFASRKHHFFRG